MIEKAYDGPFSSYAALKGTESGPCDCGLEHQTDGYGKVISIFNTHVCFSERTYVSAGNTVTYQFYHELHLLGDEWIFGAMDEYSYVFKYCPWCGLRSL